MTHPGIGGSMAAHPPGSGGAAHEHRDDTSRHEEPKDFRLSPGRHQRTYTEDEPEEPISPECQPGKLAGALGDNGNHRRANTIKHGLHPGQSAESDVQSREHEHHE
jgi:hypothetical protein